jgi:uncharacterized circularly permuted ATP-grasp superfamily protein/uncharacterized alpha-E superfamily protein
MASQIQQPAGLQKADSIRQAYCADAGSGDVMCALVGGAGDVWQTILEEILEAGEGTLGLAEDRLQRQVQEIGTSFRLSDESEERPWPVSPFPLVIEEGEWSKIADAVMQRAELSELLLADIYGGQRLVAANVLPAAALTGSPHYLSPMVGIPPPGGHYLHVYAADVGRGAGGEWRILADHTRSPAGAGYALENRLAASQVLGRLTSRLNIRRLAPFFAELRAGIAASCERSEPRIALLTPGRFNQSYAEQAHLARYLGLLLVEGADVAVHDDRVYLRTIEGMKRVDALWQRMDARLLDPLALDSRSAIGVPGLVDAMAAGGTVVTNFPGSAVLEAPLFAAFMPKLSQRLTGEALRLPNIATWWCGQDAEYATVRKRFDELVVAPAFGTVPVGLGEAGARIGADVQGAEREQLIADLERRPQDYLGQEVVKLSTMPVTDGGRLVPRPFTLRVFAARTAAGGWTVMPGGFVRMGPIADIRATSIGAGTRSADVIVHSQQRVQAVSLLSNGTTVIRRNPGTLPSRVADNLFWLGRYLERGEAMLALVRTGWAGALDSDSDGTVTNATTLRICKQLIAADAVNNRPTDRPADIFAAALDDLDASSSVASLLAAARTIGAGSRERIAPDFWQLLASSFPGAGLFPEKNLILKSRFAAFAGLAAEHMGRTASWRFHDLGRRVERAIALSRLIGDFAGDDASANDLSVLLDLTDSQISYRQRYSTGLALLPVRDLVGLDPFNPRSIAFQVRLISDHLDALPRLTDDGMAEPQQNAATSLVATISTITADALTREVCNDLVMRLLTLSNLVSHRFFLRGSEALRGAGMTLA